MGMPGAGQISEPVKLDTFLSADSLLPLWRTAADTWNPNSNKFYFVYKKSFPTIKFPLLLGGAGGGQERGTEQGNGSEYSQRVLYM